MLDEIVKNNRDAEIDITLSYLKSLTKDLVKEKKELEKILRFSKKSIEEDAFSISAYAAANSIQGIYTKIEEMFKIVAKSIDNFIPSGEHWHKTLLNQMRGDTAFRGQVVSDDLYDKLDTIRGFRHVVCHSYGSKLDGSTVFQRAALCLEVIDEFSIEINLFCTAPKEAINSVVIEAQPGMR
jgi:uncharacterized protein YutE (UPF0331/DUF86 family)